MGLRDLKWETQVDGLLERSYGMISNCFVELFVRSLPRFLLWTACSRDWRPWV